MTIVSIFVGESPECWKLKERRAGRLCGVVGQFVLVKLGNEGQGDPPCRRLNVRRFLRRGHGGPVNYRCVVRVMENYEGCIMSFGIGR